MEPNIKSLFTLESVNVDRPVAGRVHAQATINVVGLNGVSNCYENYRNVAFNS